MHLVVALECTIAAFALFRALSVVIDQQWDESSKVWCAQISTRLQSCLEQSP